MMSERDYAPLSSACVRALNDKLYDKRKAAALEIEKMVKEFAATNNIIQIKRLLKVLGQDFATSQNPHTRKGGLIGLAAIAVALGKDTSQYTAELIHPILACFCDSDLRVRYYACESLYNVVKVARGSVLVHFTDIFSALSKLAADPDQNVKNGSELLDRLMKDIVTESSTFDLVSFMPLLRERIYTKNTFARQFIISWVSVLDAVPDIDLILFLPEILDGLFRILEDPTLEIKKMCDTVLGEFLRSIKSDPSRVDFAGMINILTTHAQATDELLQVIVLDSQQLEIALSLTWIKEFVNLSGRRMLPFASGILTAVLPCLSYDNESRKNIKETAKVVNIEFMKLISSDDDNFKVSNPDKPSETPIEGNILENKLDVPSLVDVLTKHMLHTSVPTKVAVLQWIHHLCIKIPNKMFCHIDELFPVLLRVLSDTSDEVVQQALVVLAEIISSPAGRNKKPESILPMYEASFYKTHGANEKMNPYFSKFIVSLLKLFSTDKQFLEDRGSFIIRQLCVLLNSEDIYKTLAEILRHEENLKFASTMVQTLNTILLTSSELFELRTKLKDDKTEESCQLFRSLYESWSHSPVATVALCLLTQNYTHVCELIRIFGSLEVTVEFLVELDKLVQLIESPIFTYLRLELLEVPHCMSLVQALYGILMLLPQTEAFHTLRQRLDCIPSLHLQYYNAKLNVQKDETNKFEKHIDFKVLLQHFVNIQEKHKQYKHAIRTAAMLEKGIANLDT